MKVPYVNLRLPFSIGFAIACWLYAPASATERLSESRHVVVVVWDGMRPDFMSEENTPTLWKFAREGVTFRNHHALYPSATNVNGTGLVTGAYPGRNGIIANHVYRPEIDVRRTIDVEIPSVVSKGDAVSGGKYVSTPTLTELVQRTGGRTVVASAKTVGLLLDRNVGHASGLPSADAASGTHALPSEARTKNDATLFAGKSLPPEIVGSITEKLGAFPSARVQQDAWTTKALTEFLWKDGVPALSILWLGEPDLTQHEKAPGAPEALAAIKSSDQNLAAVLAALDQQDARASTNVFVVSDHGFSTIQRSIDLPKILNDAGFAAKLEFSGEPQPGDIMLAGNGGSVLFYVIGHDEKLIRRLVEFLQQSDFAGVIFTKEPMEGTFGLTQALIQRGDAPDVVMAFRWTDLQNQFGVTGEIDADWQRAAGKGTHATLSRFDMHNTLIAAGPDFKRGQTDDLPTGNVDLVPTILQILGIKVPHQMDGRILSEAVAVPTSLLPAPKPEAKSIEARKDFPSGTWRQTLKISRVGSTIYLDEGNGAFVANEPATNESQRNR
ncbi:MAG TPA: alkaline phosphatase family protein [Candidatus Udaeobacter sp.]|nr:alkaline phosphatase family protein [Candidatus Udaeobacter sp.]